jgi:hypothetical protein
MTGDDMATQFVANFQRAFEVQLAAFIPDALCGFGDSFSAGINSEPAFTLVHHCQAAAGTGDGRAEIDAVHIIAGADNDAEVAALLGLADSADVSDYACEHGVAS